MYVPSGYAVCRDVVRLEEVTLARSLPCFTQSLRDNIAWLLLALSTDQCIELVLPQSLFCVFIIIIFAFLTASSDAYFRPLSTDRSPEEIQSVNCQLGKLLLHHPVL